MGEVKTGARTSDPLGRYYTDSSIASLLISAMSGSPATVIDLGAGDGALVREAAKTWKDAQFHTVDIDVNARCIELSNTVNSPFRHHIGDALDRRLAEKIDMDFGSADSALCNPPYIRPRWRKHFAEILEDAGLSHILPHIRSVPSDLLFIAQNLRFLKPGGRLGLILPDGMVAGERFQTLRETLTVAHRLERVIELPRRIFKNTDAKAHIVVLAKNADSDSLVPVQRLQADGSLTSVIELPIESAKRRLDYSFYSEKSIHRKGQTLGDLTLSVRRGHCSSASRKNLDLPVFHTTDFPSDSEYVPRSFLIRKKAAQELTDVFAGPGDIVLARVGRNLENKVSMVRNGFVIVSDCVLILRVSPQYQERVFRFLRSKIGKQKLSSLAHGVAAKFITPSGLLDMEF